MSDLAATDCGCGCSNNGNEGGCSWIIILLLLCCCGNGSSCFGGFEMDAAITAAVPLSGSYLSCAAVETASKSTPPSGHKL